MLCETLPAWGSRSSASIPVAACLLTPSVTLEGFSGTAGLWGCPAVRPSSIARLKDLNRKRELRLNRPGSSLGLWVEALRLVRKRVCFSMLRLGLALPPGCTLCSFILLDFQAFTGRVCDFLGSLGLFSSGPGAPVFGKGILAAGDLRVRERLKGPLEGTKPSPGSRYPTLAKLQDSEDPEHGAGRLCHFYGGKKCLLAPGLARAFCMPSAMGVRVQTTFAGRMPSWCHSQRLSPRCPPSQSLRNSQLDSKEY